MFVLEFIPFVCRGTRLKATSDKSQGISPLLKVYRCAVVFKSGLYLGSFSLIVLHNVGVFVVYKSEIPWDVRFVKDYRTLIGGLRKLIHEQNKTTVL